MTCHTEIMQCLDTYQLEAVSGEEERLHRDFFDYFVIDSLCSKSSLQTVQTTF